MDNDLHDRTFTLEVYGIDRELSLALVTRAANDGILIQELVHRILRDELLPDIPAPIDRVADKSRGIDVLDAPRMCDLPSIPERTLEQAEDALYGPQLRVSKLVDTPSEYDAEAS